MCNAHSVCDALGSSTALIPNDLQNFQAGIWKTAYRFLIFAFQVSCLFISKHFSIINFWHIGKKSSIVAEWKARLGARRSRFLTWVLSPTGPTGRYIFSFSLLFFCMPYLFFCPPPLCCTSRILKITTNKYSRCKLPPICT
jgi:hypothetical protein